MRVASFSYLQAENLGIFLSLGFYLKVKHYFLNEHI